MNYADVKIEGHQIIMKAGKDTNLFKSAVRDKYLPCIILSISKVGNLPEYADYICRMRLWLGYPHNVLPVMLVRRILLILS